MSIAKRRAHYSSNICRSSCLRVEPGWLALLGASTTGRWNGCWKIVKAAGLWFRIRALSSRSGFSPGSSSSIALWSCSYRGVRRPAQLEIVIWLIWQGSCLASGRARAAERSRRLSMRCANEERCTLFRFFKTLMSRERWAWFEILVRPLCSLWSVGRSHSTSQRSWRRDCSPRRGPPSLGTEPKTHPSPRSGRQMKRAQKPAWTQSSSFADLRHVSPASQAPKNWRLVTPGSASPSPGAISLPARFAGSLNNSLCHRFFPSQSALPIV